MKPQSEGSSIPWGGWAAPRGDTQKGDSRRERLTKSFWQEVGSAKRPEQSSEWVDLDELLQGWK